ncbi:MarR family winged helix-turn-helix transcriptional regulator [Actinomadura sp. WMMB 499]|uniref:MarR family winged helix-turn-helix transcriptional regulator n=1 Tax=Actinomadura sp. WMMB 499 TaxID=1219491 RepID=UPI001244E8B2|nr:MarR family transcriptional regulator [Actinomadura sp. WMMB 499]QFG21150.1 MarR family transcriptional regulator [Actinomadura sp. WMMB 499]
MTQRRPGPPAGEHGTDGTGAAPAEAPGDVPGDVTVAVERVLSNAALLWSRADQGLEPAVSPIQLRAVEAIARFGRLNLGGLADELGAIPSSTSRLCDRLEAAGLVVRETAPADRREIIVRLTEQGERLHGELTRRRRDAVHEVLEHMSPTSRGRLIDALTEFGLACERRESAGTGPVRAAGPRTA